MGKKKSIFPDIEHSVFTVKRRLAGELVQGAHHHQVPDVSFTCNHHPFFDKAAVGVAGSCAGLHMDQMLAEMRNAVQVMFFNNPFQSQSKVARPPQILVVRTVNLIFSPNICGKLFALILRYLPPSSHELLQFYVRDVWTQGGLELGFI